MLPVKFIRNGTENWLGRPLDLFDRWSELDPFFKGVFGRETCGGFPVDIRHEGDDLIIDAELPGLSKEDIEITAEENVLTITANYNECNEEEQEHYHLKERRCGKAARSFRLDSTADAENVSANLKDGVLSLRIPTRPEAKPRKIEVK